MSAQLVAGAPPTLYTFDEFTGDPELSPAYDFTRETRSVTRSGIIHITAGVAGAELALQELIQRTLPDPAVGTLILPGQHPTVSYLWVNTIRLTPDFSNQQPGNDGFQVINGITVWHRYKIQIVYTVLPYDTLTGIEITNSFGYEDVGLDGSGGVYWTWQSETDSTASTPARAPALGFIGADAGRVTAAVQVSVNEHSFKFHRVPLATYNTLTATIRDAQGKVNDALFYGAEKETLKFDGAVTSYTIGPLGARVYELDYRFSEKRIDDGAGGYYGWNHDINEYDTSTGVLKTMWDRLSTDRDNYEPKYQLYDFNNLFMY